MELESLPVDAFAHVLLQLSPAGRPLNPSIHSLTRVSQRLNQAVYQAAPYWSAVGRTAWGSGAYIPGAPEYLSALRNAHQFQTMPCCDTSWPVQFGTGMWAPAAPAPLVSLAFEDASQGQSRSKTHAGRIPAVAAALGRAQLFWRPGAGAPLLTDPNEQGHTGQVTSLLPVVSGGHIAGYVTGSADRTVKLWNPSKGASSTSSGSGHILRPVRTLRHHGEGVTCLALISVGEQAAICASGSSDKTVQLCSLAPLVPSPAASLTASASPDLKMNATSSTSGAGSSQSGGQGGSKVLGVLRGHESEVRALCVVGQGTAGHGAGPALASGGLDGRIKWWDIRRCAAPTQWRTPGHLPVTQLLEVESGASGSATPLVAAAARDRILLLDPRAPAPTATVMTHSSGAHRTGSSQGKPAAPVQMAVHRELLAYTTRRGISVADTRVLTSSTSTTPPPVMSLSAETSSHSLTQPYIDHQKVLALSTPSPPKPAKEPSSGRSRSHSHQQSSHTTGPSPSPSAATPPSPTSSLTVWPLQHAQPRLHAPYSFPAPAAQLPGPSTSTTTSNPLKACCSADPPYPVKVTSPLSFDFASNVDGRSCLLPETGHSSQGGGGSGADSSLVATQQAMSVVGYAAQGATLVLLVGRPSQPVQLVYQDYSVGRLEWDSLPHGDQDDRDPCGDHGSQGDDEGNDDGWGDENSDDSGGEGSWGSSRNQSRLQGRGSSSRGGEPLQGVFWA